MTLLEQKRQELALVCDALAVATEHNEILDLNIRVEELLSEIEFLVLGSL